MLFSCIPDNSRIYWVTHHNADRSRRWLTKNHRDDIEVLVCDSPEAIEKTIDITADAAIIATSPFNHFIPTQACLEQGIPVLCEKPLTLSPDLSKALLDTALRKKILLCVNYEFMYATYLKDFRRNLDGVNVQNIKLVWHDPAFEERPEGIKRSEFHTPIIYDQFTHCWSILRSVFPELPFRDFSSVKYQADSEVLVSSNIQGIDTTVHMSRRSDYRQRRLSVNGDAILIDFTCEPGFIQRESAGRRDRENCAWSSGRPLLNSIQAFLAAIEHPEKVPETAAENLIDIIDLCDRLEKSILKEFERIHLSNQADNEQNTVQMNNLFIDRYLPIAFAKGERPVIETEEQQSLFINRCLMGEFD